MAPTTTTPLGRGLCCCNMTHLFSQPRSVLRCWWAQPQHCSTWPCTPATAYTTGDQEAAESQTLKESRAAAAEHLLMAFLGGLAASCGHVMVANACCSRRLSFCFVLVRKSPRGRTLTPQLCGMTDAPTEPDGTTCNHLKREMPAVSQNAASALQPGTLHT